jgi:hypothetical protein
MVDWEGPRDCYSADRILFKSLAKPESEPLELLARTRHMHGVPNELTSIATHAYYRARVVREPNKALYNQYMMHSLNARDHFSAANLPPLSHSCTQHWIANPVKCATFKGPYLLPVTMILLYPISKVYGCNQWYPAPVLRLQYCGGLSPPVFRNSSDPLQKHRGQFLEYNSFLTYSSWLIPLPILSTVQVDLSGDALPHLTSN